LYRSLFLCKWLKMFLNTIFWFTPDNSNTRLYDPFYWTNTLRVISTMLAHWTTGWQTCRSFWTHYVFRDDNQSLLFQPNTTCLAWRLHIINFTVFGLARAGTLTITPAMRSLNVIYFD
jgi:hypothetical protein